MLRSGVARTLTFTVDGTSAAARKLYALTSDGATALVEDDAGAVWLADIASGAARLVSAEADGTPVDMSYWFGDVSPDNTWVALFAITPDGSDHVVAFKNLTDGAWTVRDDSDLIWGSSLELANDGVGVYSTLRSPGPRRYEGIVFTFEAPAEFTPLVATPDGDPLFLDTTSGAIDADGTRVAFQSASNWLGVDGFLGGWDVFATDMEPGVNTLVSVGLDGAAPDDDSFGPDVAENAPDLIVFSSEATNLSPATTMARSMSSCAILPPAPPPWSASARMASRATARPATPIFRATVDTWRSSAPPPT